MSLQHEINDPTIRDMHDSIPEYVCRCTSCICRFARPLLPASHSFPKDRKSPHAVAFLQRRTYNTRQYIMSGHCLLRHRLTRVYPSIRSVS